MSLSSEQVMELASAQIEALKWAIDTAIDAVRDGFSDDEARDRAFVVASDRLRARLGMNP